MRGTQPTLRKGWTTGACAAAAAKSAAHALVHGDFLDPVSVNLPNGLSPAFALTTERTDREGERPVAAMAAITKDAGDDPDVTHGAVIHVTVRHAPALRWIAGSGVGTVTKPGLPLAVGEPAINPVPREIIARGLREATGSDRFSIEISVPGGLELAQRTWNPRLGIVGGISILGTTGVVHPFSCAAWIHSIHRGVDVARAADEPHLLAATGSTSETAARALYDVPDTAVIDMGDFAGGLLKYVRAHPVRRLTIAGGFAKLSKLANGAMDLHSARSQVDLPTLAELSGLPEIARCNTGLDAMNIALGQGIDLPKLVAAGALRKARTILGQTPCRLGILVVGRRGEMLAQVTE